MKQHLQLICMFLLLSWSTMGQTYIYVKHDAAGVNDGTSWTDAFTSLQPALTAASSSDFIWVAAGTYTPTMEIGGTGDQFKTFQLQNGLGLYGGFAGNEDPVTFDFDNRDFETNETILSGDLGGSVNVYHVFRHVNLGLNNTAVLDGFTVSNGKAVGTDPANKGGGMLNSGSSSGNGSSPTIRNCVFKNNEATEGGALYNSRYSSPAVSHTTFTNNTAATKGGAVFNVRNSPTYNNCTFSSNVVTGSASNDGGGAIYNSTSNAAEGAVISHCVFNNNIVPSSGTTTYGGGAIFSSLDPGTISITFSTFTGNSGKYGGAIYHRSGNEANRDASDVKISNSTFEQNSAEYGGAIFSDRHHSIVTSCVIRGNEAAEQAGGFYSRYASSELVNTLISGNRSSKHGGGAYFNTESPDVINSTITGNYSGERGGGISMINGSTVSLNNSIVWGNASPEGNELWLCSTCTINIDYSLYSNASGDVFITTGGAVNATNSLTSNPIFLNPYDLPTSGNTPNVLGNYFICGCTSPCIDAGLNTHVPSGITEDLRGTDRFLDGNGDSNAIVDLGAYEFDPNGCNALEPFAGDGSAGNPYEISMLQHLYWVAVDPARWVFHYIQTADIDACNTETWFGGEGWTPIGNSSTPFIGSYDGGGHSISKLQISRTSQELGLFGRLGESFGTNKGVVKDLSLTDVDFNGEDNYIGGLAGYQEGSSSIENVHVTGTIKGRTDTGSGSRHIGGIAGESRGSVANCSFIGSVRGHGYIGGLIGESRGQVSNSFTSGTVETNKDFSGGLIGRVSAGSVIKSYSTADITTLATYVYYAGGFVGEIISGTVSECYSTGDVSGLRNQAGGFVGRSRGIITNCYARGSVSRNGGSGADFGGFVGWNERGKVINSYSTGKVEWESAPHPTDKGFAGKIDSGTGYEMTGNFWDTETSGQATTSGNATGETTANMKTASTFTTAGWDFTNSWAISPATNNGYPNLDGKSAITWNGNTNSDWATESNWSTGSLPTASDDVIIPVVTNAPIIGSGITASCNNLVIESGGELTIDGTLDNSGTVTVNSNASASGSLILNGTLTGNVTYNRYLVNDRWHLISSPVAGQSFNSTFFADNSIDHNPGSTEFALIDYDTETNQWNPYPGADASGTFTSAKGFLMARYVASTDGGTVGFTGTVNTSDVSFTPSITGYRWNAVGNPFTSAIGINPNAGTDNFINENLSNLDESFTAIYYWDDTDGGIGNYIPINQSSPAFYAAPGQGFFVQAASGATAINFPVSLRTHQGSVTLKSGQVEWPQLEITAKSGDARSVATIKFVDGSTPGLDVGYDAGKFKSNPEINLFTKLVDDNGIDFGLQCLPPTQMELLTIPVGLDVKSAGEITFSINYSTLPENQIPVLEDRLLNIQTPFETGNNNYTTTVSESESDYGRFYISFSSTTNVAQIQNGTFFRAWYSNNTIQIQGNVEGAAIITLYDINGKALMQKKVANESQNSLSIPNLGNGIYLVKIADSNRTELLKVPVLK